MIPNPESHWLITLNALYCGTMKNNVGYNIQNAEYIHEHMPVNNLTN